MQGQEGVENVRVEMAAAAVPQDRHCFAVGQGGLVHSLADQRIVDVGDGHQARRQGDTFAAQAKRIPAAIPFFLVGEGDLLGKAQEACGDAEQGLRLGDGVPAKGGVGLHDLELGGGELAGLEEDAVGNADLADVVQWRRLVHQFDVAVGEFGGEAWVVLQVSGEGAQIHLGTPDVVAGFVVAGLRQGGHGDDGGVLDQAELPGAPYHLVFQVGVAVTQEVAGGLQGEVVADARQHQGRADGLGDVVHRAGVKAQLLIHFLVADGQEDHRDAGGEGVVHQLATHLEAVPVGHADVEQDEIGQGLAGGERQCTFAVCGDAGAEAGPVQAVHDGFDGVRGVVDDQDQRVERIGGRWHGVLLAQFSGLRGRRPRHCQAGRRQASA